MSIMVINKKCPICDKQFKISPYQNDRVRYCSTKCFGKSIDTRVTKYCEICQSAYKIKRSHAHLRKTCSKKCNSIYMRSKTAWNKGIKTGLVPKTAFKKGQKPWNKGKPGPAGKDAFHWKGGRVIGTYISIYQPHHPRARGNYIGEHILIVEKCLGRFLTPQEEVHHINFDKHDNRPQNLFVFESSSIHKSFHMCYRYHPILKTLPIESNIINSP